MSNMVNVLSTVATVITLSGVDGLQMHFDEAEEKLQSRTQKKSLNPNPSKWQWEDRILIAAPTSKAPVEFKPTAAAPEWHVRLQGPREGIDFGAGTLHYLRTKNSAAEESLVVSTVVHNLDDNSGENADRSNPTSYKFDRLTKIIHAQTDYLIATLEMKPNDNEVEVRCGSDAEVEFGPFTKTTSFDDTVMFDRNYFLEERRHHHEFDVMFITLPEECKGRAEKYLEARNSDAKRQWTLPLMDPSELKQGSEVECITTDSKKEMDGKRGETDIWTREKGWPVIGENEFGQFHFGFTVPEGEAFDRTFAREAQADVLNANIHSFTATKDDNGNKINKGDNPGVDGDLSYPGRNLFWFAHDVGFNGYSGGGYACRYVVADDATGDVAGDWFMWSVHQSGKSPRKDRRGVYGPHSSMSVLAKRSWERLSEEGVHATIVDRIARALHRDGHLRPDAPLVRFEDWFTNLSEHTCGAEDREKYYKTTGKFPKGFWRSFCGIFGYKKSVTKKLADLHTRTAIIHQLYVKPLKEYFGGPAQEPRAKSLENSPLNRQLRNILVTAKAFEDKHQICQKMESLAAKGGYDKVERCWYDMCRVDNACPIRVWNKLR